MIRRALILLAVWGAAAGPATAQTIEPRPLAAPQPGRITGRVVREGGVALAHAWIRVRAGDGVHYLLTDSLGGWSLGVPPGRAFLEADYIGHRQVSVEVTVPSGATVQVDLTLETQAVDLPGIVVRADPLSVRTPTPPHLRPLSPPETSLQITALTLDPGLADVAAAAAAARERSGESPADGAQVLLMRGSTADLKLLLLDGAPVYTPFHLGGLLESFDADVLGRAAHYVGGAPSRYDGGIDYILDLDTRPPTASGTRFRGAIDLISARASAEWGEPRGGILASARMLHGAGPALLDGVANPYGYRDGLVRGAWTVAGVSLGLTGFANRESVALGLPDAPLVPDRAAWSNRALSIRATHVVGPVEIHWMAAASGYDAALPLRTDSTVTPSTRPVLADGHTGRRRATLDGMVDLGPGSLRFGLSFDRTRAAYGSSLHTATGHMRTDARVAGRSIGAHGQYASTLSRDVAVRVGARIDHFDPGGARGALRGSLAWMLTPTATLSLAAGRYHQFTRASDADVEDALVSTPDSVGVVGHAGSTLLSVATGDHVVVGLDQTLSPTLQLGLQGFVKRFSDIDGIGSARSSSGVDFRLRATGAERVGWLGYSLSWTWADDAGNARTRRFLGRHLMSAGYRGPIGGPIDIEARLAFSDGLPYTEVPLGQRSDFIAAETPLEPEGARNDPALAGRRGDGFLRLDLEVAGEWDSPIGDGRIRPYLRVLNALDRRDALFYYFEPWRSPELTPLAHRSLLPIVGVAWRF